MPDEGVEMSPIAPMPEIPFAAPPATEPIFGNAEPLLGPDDSAPPLPDSILPLQATHQPDNAASDEAPAPAKEPQIVVVKESPAAAHRLPIKEPDDAGEKVAHAVGMLIGFGLSWLGARKGSKSSGKA